MATPKVFEKSAKDKKADKKHGKPDMKDDGKNYDKKGKSMPPPFMKKSARGR